MCLHSSACFGVKSPTEIDHVANQIAENAKI